MPSGASQHRDLYDGGGHGDGQAHAVSVRARTRGGADGASRRHCRGALDGAGGASGELCGGADDADARRDAAARARQHGAVEELSGPLAQGPECALGGEPRSVRIDVARHDGGARGGGDGGGLARWGDGSDERREASREARALTRCGPAREGAGRLPGGELRDAVVLRCRRGTARYLVHRAHARTEKRRR